MKGSPRKKVRVTTTAPTAIDAKTSRGSFPIVGIGASAGGLEAFSELLRYLPEKTGMAFVLVQHLDPKHGSALQEILARASKIPSSGDRSDSRCRGSAGPCVCNSR